MSDLKKTFGELVKKVRGAEVDKKPSQSEKLKLYAWYKQATEGDVAGEAPGGADIVGKAKHNAWSKVKGMTADEAMKQYINFFK